MAQTNKITSWSYSRFGVYDLCPAKAKYKFLMKLPEPSSEAMENGNRVHKSLEGYLKGDIHRLSSSYNPKVFGDLLKKLRSKRRQDDQAVLVEDTWAYRADWSETRWDDWNYCWLRIKIDCADISGDGDDITVSIRDWKTGKFRPTDESSYGVQLDLYALGALMRYKESKEVTVLPSLVYIDAGVEHSTGVYTKKDLPRLKKEWEKRVRPMLSDTTFAPKPNNLCRFCTYRRENGGPCKF